MHSTLKLRESDPHDAFAIVPETVPAAWADKVLADITRDAGGRAAVQPPTAGSSAASAPPPKVDMTFRATAANDIHTPNIHVPGDRPAGPPPTGSWARSTIIAFMFALCSAVAAAAWQHYGAPAKQMISAWTPPFALTSSQPPESTGLAAQPATPADQAPTADQAPPQPAQAQPAEGAAPAVTAPSADATQLQSMAHDLATMGQEIELLKATVAELRTGQQAVATETAKTSTAKPSVQTPRPRTSVPPPRAAAVSARKPMQPYPQAYPAQAYPPVQAAAPQPLPQPMPPPPPAAAQFDGDDPVVRPPMPLH
jgi:hypothetical protein